jgi:hypothetical protein
MGKVIFTNIPYLKINSIVNSRNADLPVINLDTPSLIEFAAATQVTRMFSAETRDRHNQQNPQVF